MIVYTVCESNNMQIVAIPMHTEITRLLLKFTEIVSRNVKIYDFDISAASVLPIASAI